MTIDEMIEVLQAAKAGKSIEFTVRENKSAEWYPWLGDPSHVWNFGTCDYRVRPEPRRLWVNEHKGRLYGETFFEMLSDAEKFGPSSCRQVEFVEVLP